MHRKKVNPCGSISFIGVALAVLLAGSNPVSAHRNPSDCNANNVRLDIARNKINIQNGETVTYTITIENPIGEVGGQKGCDVTLGAGGLVFTCPGPDGTPSGTQTTLIAGGTLLPGFGVGFGPQVFTVSCVINLNPGVPTAQARVSAPGAQLHDNPLQDDPANIDKTISVNRFTPCIDVTKECVNPCVPYGQPIAVRGTVRNCGDVPLANVTVVDDHAGPVLGPISLAPGASANYSATYPAAGNLCGPFTDTVTATGTTIGLDVPATVTDTASATCHVQTNPRITLTKDCQPRSIPAGGTYTETFVVCNTGNVPLVGVVINDSRIGPIAIGNLAVGQCVTNVQGPFTTTTADCPFVEDRATATGNNACPPDAVCPAPRTASSAEVTCRVNVLCVPRIEVHKQVVCVNPDGTCGPFNANLGTQKTASGVKDGSCPAFCYRITVINTSDAGIELRNLQVSDDSIPDPNLNLAACGFPTTLAAPGSPGDRASCIVPAVTHCQDTRDIVTATANGVSAVDGTFIAVVTDRDTNDVRVLNINIVCESALFSAMDTDGNPNDCNLTLPQAFTGPVTLTVTLRNTGTSPLDVTSLSGLPALVDCASGAPVVVSLPITIAAGGSHTIQGCFDVTLNTCPTNIPINVRAHAEANDMNGTLCVYDSTGRRISDDSGPNECNCTITCIPVQEIECRVTGGGVLLPGGFDESCIRVDTTIFPMQIQGGLTVRKITHGGQLGAPFSHRDCGEILGNQCIRGQWSHTRHYEGKANPRDVFDMSFHSTTPKGIYDSLLCACLGCCDPESGAFITPITIGGICNPDDHKICGPQPRPAPANVIIWSGIGKITPEDDTSGPRAARSEWVIYRTYIEDRSEPGGYHPGGAVEPADIYCFQAWKTGIRVSRKPDFSTVATEFRRRLGQANCDFLAALEAGALPIGTLPSPTVDGVTADIQDCGPMSSGNHQIHPATGANDKCNP